MVMPGNNPFQPWMDLFGMDPKLGAASAGMMRAWTEAWQATLTGRALPAMALLNPATWGGDGGDVADAIETAFGMPRWSDMASLDSEAIKAIAPGVELLQIGQLYMAALTRAVIEICREFQTRATENGMKLSGSGEALDLWNATVDEVLMRFNRSEDFADLQRRFVRALMAHRLAQRRLTEQLAERFDLPTREEVDELARRVHDLERENRRLRRAAQAPAPAERTKP